jgi:chromosome segregation ATPase
MPVEKVPSWFRQFLMPEINEIKGKLEAINTKIESTNERIDSLRNETKSEIARLEERIDSLRNETKMEIGSLRTEMTVRLDSIEKRIPVIEEITALKLRIAELEKKFAVA